MELRGYQQDAKNRVLQAWASGARNVGLQSGTGSGKTVICCSIISEEREPVMVVAHRMEILGQLSVTLGRYGIRHNVMAPSGVVRGIVSAHMIELGCSFYDPQSRCTVAGVDTLILRNEPWFKQVKLLMQDEAHHVLRENKWGKVAEKFPNARGLYPTATPQRADGRGLGRHADGVLDTLIIGVSEFELINQGFLSRYKPCYSTNDLDLSKVTITASGEYSLPKLRNAVHRSRITGDIPTQYLKHAKGKLGITFCVDIKAAQETAEGYRAVGVAAELITGKTPDILRAQIMRRFYNREIHQIVNVGIIGEGVHVPGVEAVSIGAPTASLAKCRQEMGRVLAVTPGKDTAIIIDHAGNIARHGLPDRWIEWSLDRRERRARSTPLDVIPLRNCLNPECCAIYERIYRTCPHCGFVHVPAERGSPEAVDGDLVELDPAVLAKLRGEINRIDGTVRIPQNLSEPAQCAVANRHSDRQVAQGGLRAAIALWAGYQRTLGREDSEIYRRFYFLFGTDVASAQALGASAASELQIRIETILTTLGVTAV